MGLPTPTERDFLPGHLTCSANVVGVLTCSDTPRGPRLDNRELATPSKNCHGERRAGRANYEFAKLFDASVLDVSRGPRPDIVQTKSLINFSRSRMGRVGVEPTTLSGAPDEGVSWESYQSNLLVGEVRVEEIRGPRAGRDRKLVCVRVVGDGAFGWAEAANASGATVELMVHLKVNNHMVSKLFALPKSCR